jgi:site-specific recombinase XerD
LRIARDILDCRQLFFNGYRQRGGAIMGRVAKGNLFVLRGKFALQYYVSGREHKHLLRDDDGAEIPRSWRSDDERERHCIDDPTRSGGKRYLTQRQVAEAAAERIIAPLRMRNEAQRLRSVVADLSALEERVIAAEAAEVNRRATPLKIWQIYAAIQYPEYAVGAIPPTNSRAYTIRLYLRDFADFCAEKKITSFAKITAHDAARYFASRNFPASSHNDRLQNLNTVFKRLIKHQKIIGAVNPFGEIDKKREGHYRKKNLTKEQLRALFDAAENAEWRAFFMAGYFVQGLRRGDAATLRKGEIFLERGVIERVQNKLRSRMANLDEAGIFSGINAQLREAITPFVLAAKTASDFIFPNVAKIALGSHTKFNTDIRKTFERAGMINTRRNAAGRLIVDYGFHSLRHSFATDSIAAGAALLETSAAMGHHDGKMTAHYVHVSDEMARAAAEKLSV